MTVQTSAPVEAEETQVFPRAVPSGWPTVPRVNLLPPEIVERRRFRQVQVALAAAVLVTAGAAIAAFLWAQSSVDAAQDRLAQVEVRTAQLQNEQRQYAEVPQVVAELQAAQDARQVAMARDVVWHQVLNALAQAAGSTVQVSQIQITLGGAEGAPADGQTSVTPAGIGTATFSGSAGAYRDVSAWIEAVEAITGFDASGLTSATQEDVTAGAAAPEGVSTGATGGAGGGPVTFTTSASLTDTALSHRYDRKAG